jgi:hypothetical protein
VGLPSSSRDPPCFSRGQLRAAGSTSTGVTSAGSVGQLLPVNAVLGAFILRGDMHTKADEWVLKDLKKTTDSNQMGLMTL